MSDVRFTAIQQVLAYKYDDKPCIYTDEGCFMSKTGHLIGKPQDVKKMYLLRFQIHENEGRSIYLKVSAFANVVEKIWEMTAAEAFDQLVDQYNGDDQSFFESIERELGPTNWEYTLQSTVNSYKNNKGENKTVINWVVQKMESIGEYQPETY